MDEGVRASPEKQGCPRDPKRYYYEKADEFDEDGDPKLARTGAIASCDEFPAAIWIQGGAGAQAICAPFGIALWSKTGPGAKKRKLVKEWMTEQNWQGGAELTWAVLPRWKASNSNAVRAGVSSSPVIHLWVAPEPPSPRPLRAWIGMTRQATPRPGRRAHLERFP